MSRAGPGEVDAAALEGFGARITAAAGLRIDDLNRARLREGLAARVLATGAASVDAYLERLDRPGVLRAEIEVLAETLTVGESWLFRAPGQLEALTATVLPELLAGRAPGRPLRVLSAGCAGGEEAFTVAMILAEPLRRRGIELAILGVDLNPSAIARARRARYTAWQLREVPGEVRARAFVADGAASVVRDELRALVTFEQRNLCEDDPALWAPGRFDLIFCRNVVIYFAAEPLRALGERLALALRPGGHLFLGDAEPLRDPPALLEVRQTATAFHYRRLAAPVSSSRPLQVGVADVSAVVELFREERFVEADRAIMALPEDARDDRVLLIHAQVLTNMGRAAEAEALARRVLTRNAGDAGARFVLAVCRETLGDVEGARRGHEATIRLDAGFALAHLHVGRLARLAGDRAAARRAIARAHDLLQTEDAARIALFGGGFPREALLDLCRSQLRGLGGDA